MSLETMRVWVETTIQSAMRTTYPGVAVHYQNARFLQPESIWASLKLLDGKSFGTNLGSRKVDRHVGIIQLDVLAPEHTGTSHANQIVEFVGNLLRNRKIGLDDGASVVLRQPEYTTSGTTVGFHRSILRVPYWRDEPQST